FERSHLPHIRRAHNHGWRVVLEGGQRKRRLRGGRYFKPFTSQRVGKPLRKQHVAVNHEDLGRLSGHDHACASGLPLCARLTRSPGTGVSASRFNTSMTSPSCESHAATCGESDSPAGVKSAVINSHSPLTGSATQSSVAPRFCVATR